MSRRRAPAGGAERALPARGPRRDAPPSDVRHLPRGRFPGKGVHKRHVFRAEVKDGSLQLVNREQGTANGK